MNPYDSLSNSIFGPGGFQDRTAAVVAAQNSAAPAAMNTNSFGSSITSFFNGLTNTAGAVAPSYFNFLATKELAGRRPGAEMYANPLAQPVGQAGQPGTTPVLVGQAQLASVTPWLLLGAAVIGGVLLVKALK